MLSAVETVSVVLVEDSETYAALVGHVLRAASPGGARVRVHGTLAEALTDLRDEPADCVVLDLSLPDAAGLEALAVLHAAGVEAPIVVLSGLEDEGAELDAIEAGAQEFLRKGAERDVAAFGRALRHAIARGRAQERGEDLLRAKEDRWRTVSHQAPVGIVETDLDGRCVFANDRLCEIAGRSGAALMGYGLLDTIHPDDRPRFDAASRVAFERAGEFSIDLRFLRPGGDVIWAVATGSVVRDPWGGPAGWIGTIVDVSEARSAQEELRRQQEDVLAVAQLARDVTVEEDACPALCAGARHLLDADFAVVLLEDGTGALRLAAEDGAELPADTRIASDDGVSGAAGGFRSRERGGGPGAGGGVGGEAAAANAGVVPALAGAPHARGIVFEPIVRGAEPLGVLAIG